jgi:hypothetical protein
MLSNQSSSHLRFLSSIGVTPLMAAMVMKNEFLFSCYEDLDRCWKLLGETSIKARSIRGAIHQFSRMILNSDF